MTSLLSSSSWLLKLPIAVPKQASRDVWPGESEDIMHLMEFGFSSDSYNFCLSLVKLVHLERKKPFYRDAVRL